MYLGGYSGYYSQDGGASWDSLNTPDLEGNDILEITCHPYNLEEVYLSIYSNGIYKSYNAGDTWVNITNNLPHSDRNTFFTGLAINELNPDNMFINSHHYGIFQTHDGGDSWEPFNEGLNTLYNSATTIIDPLDTNRIYLATNEQSAWSIHRTPTAWDTTRTCSR